jgi:hypothetical protein
MFDRQGHSCNFYVGFGPTNYLRESISYHFPAVSALRVRHVPPLNHEMLGEQNMHGTNARRREGNLTLFEPEQASR